MPAFDAAKLRSALADCTIGREIVVLEETTSTNDSVLQMTNATTPEGLVVFAEHQTAGRGQHGNRWESVTHKGLWFSILLRPKIEIGESARLTAWTADTVANTIREQFSLKAKVKPPNDVYVDGRKVAGVLVEMRAQKKRTASGHCRNWNQREPRTGRFSRGDSISRYLTGDDDESPGESRGIGHHAAA